jgi:uncharacterized membrane protein
MPEWVNRLFLAFHVFGAFMWIGGLFQLALLLGAVKQEPDGAAKKRLLTFTRKAARIPDIGATLAILFGAHWLFKYQLYKMPYMHIKLTMVLIVFGMHGYLRVQTKRAAERGDANLPGFVEPLLVLLTLGIMAVVLIKSFA